MAKKAAGAAPPVRDAIELAPGVRRIIAPNPNAFTQHGTNTYLVGGETLAVIDPGPDDDAHLDNILQAANGAPIDAIILTHTHFDHFQLAPRLKAATGAPLAGIGYSSSGPGDADRQFEPDIVLRDGSEIGGAGWRLRTIAMPGHASDHATFELAGTDILFSGDHVMGWSTTVIAPPDGSMSAFMASLRKLLDMSHSLYFPGHGEPIDKPRDYVRQLLGHRLARSASILKNLEKGSRDIPAIVDALYSKIKPDLRGAAAMTVHAHLVDLVEQGLVLSDGAPTLNARYKTRRS